MDIDVETIDHVRSEPSVSVSSDTNQHNTPSRETEMDPNQLQPSSNVGKMDVTNNQRQLPQANVSVTGNQAQGIPPHLIGLMTNPALAVAAGTSPLFPSATFLSNSASYLSISDPYIMGRVVQQSQQQLPMHNASPPFPRAPNNISTTNYTHNRNYSSSQTIASNNQDELSLNTPDGRELTAEERAKQSRDRNREHARSTRQRKKAYVQKLKELVEELHAERSDEVRKRRVAIQHLAEIQNVRRSVIRDFLHNYSKYESEKYKWETLLEDEFWLKQPVTPYRSFRRSEIEHESRISRGVDAVIADAASLSVMIESIGSRSTRWLQIKREAFLQLEEAHRGERKTPRCIVQQESRLNHAISSLSSSYGSNEPPSSSEHGSDSDKNKARPFTKPPEMPNDTSSVKPKNVSSLSGSSNQESANNSNFHDYFNNKPLPDPKMPSSDNSNPSADGSSPVDDPSSSDGHTKRVSTASSSSSDDSGSNTHEKKRRKVIETSSDGKRKIPVPEAEIAKKGGIPHNTHPPAIRADSGSDNSRLSAAPVIPLPPFAGLGKKHSRPTTDGEVSSASTITKHPQIYAEYYVNDDDMVIMEDVVMCPYVFRSHDAVTCGALSECVVPGMLRATFSSRNKLKSLEFVYDSMGLMQQLERASGNEGMAQVVPGSLEMALTLTSQEARVITLAKAPYRIINVNELWTKVTGYTQMEVEGREYKRVLEGEGTILEASLRRGKPKHTMEEVATGRAACSTNIHYDCGGQDFIEFVASYPLTNANDEVTHLLHVSKELPVFQVDGSNTSSHIT